MQLLLPVLAEMPRNITSADVISWTTDNKSNMWPQLGSTTNKEYSNSFEMDSGWFVYTSQKPEALVIVYLTKL